MVFARKRLSLEEHLTSSVTVQDSERQREDYSSHMPASLHLLLSHLDHKPQKSSATTTQATANFSLTVHRKGMERHPH